MSSSNSSKQHDNIQQLVFLKVEQSDIVKLKELLASFPSLINTQSIKSGQTLLTVATRKNDAQMVKFLIDKGADVNQTNKFKQSPLWISAFYQHNDICDILLQYSPNLDLADKKGWTPTMVACHRGSFYIMTQLIEAGANINILSHKGENLFDLAKDQETLQLLVQLLCVPSVSVKEPEKFRSKRKSQPPLNEVSKVDTLNSFDIDARQHPNEANTPASQSDTDFYQLNRSGNRTPQQQQKPSSPHKRQQQDTFNPEPFISDKPSKTPQTRRNGSTDQHTQEQSLQYRIMDTALNQIEQLFQQQFALIRRYILDNCSQAEDMEQIKNTISRVPVQITQHTDQKDLELLCNRFKSVMTKAVSSTLESLLTIANGNQNNTPKPVSKSQQAIKMKSIQDEIIPLLEEPDEQNTPEQRSRRVWPKSHNEREPDRNESPAEGSLIRLRNLNNLISQRIQRIGSK